jgi:hypothetical protein
VQRWCHASFEGKRGSEFPYEQSVQVSRIDFAGVAFVVATVGPHFVRMARAMPTSTCLYGQIRSSQQHQRSFSHSSGERAAFKFGPNLSSMTIKPGARQEQLLVSRCTAGNAEQPAFGKPMAPQEIWEGFKRSARCLQCPVLSVNSVLWCHNLER